jgi:hypothetical protein
MYTFIGILYRFILFTYISILGFFIPIGYILCAVLIPIGYILHGFLLKFHALFGVEVVRGM